MDLNPLMWHTNPQQFRVHRAVQSPSARPTAPSRHVHIARSQSIGCSRRHQFTVLCLLSRQSLPAFVGACFDTEGRPRAVQPRCAMSTSEPGLDRCGVILGSIPIAVCDLGLSWGCLCLHPSGSPTSGLPPPFGHVKDWARCDQTTPNSHSRPQSLFLVKRWFIFVQYPKVSLRQLA